MCCKNTLQHYCFEEKDTKNTKISDLKEKKCLIMQQLTVESNVAWGITCEYRAILRFLCMLKTTSFFS